MAAPLCCMLLRRFQLFQTNQLYAAKFFIRYSMIKLKTNFIFFLKDNNCGRGNTPCSTGMRKMSFRKEGRADQFVCINKWYFPGHAYS
jgi:hypothetical protein